MSAAVRGVWLAGIVLLLAALAGVAQAAPKIEHWVAANGLRVYFIPTSQLPMLDVNLVVDAGSARDGDLPGLARLTAAILDEGAGGLDAGTIARRFEEVGAKFSASIDRDMASFSLRTLSDPRYRVSALGTFETVVTKPEFPKREFDRLKGQLTVAVRSREQKPGNVASDAFYRALYGDHPFATPPTGTLDSVARISPGDVRDFYRRYYVTGNALLAMVGDIDRAQAEGIASRIDAGLARGAAAPPLPPVRPLSKSVTVRIPFPSEQTHVLIGQPGMRRGDPDYFPLYVGNHVLGGSGFTSRLVNEVREKRGLSYSVYSYFLPKKVEGPFQLGLQTRSDQAGDAEALARKTLQDFISEGPSASELEASQQNITGGFPMSIDSNADLVGYIATIGFYGLPLDYMDTLPDRVDAVTRDEVMSAFKRRLDVGNMATVIVGGEAQSP